LLLRCIKFDFFRVGGIVTRGFSQEEWNEAIQLANSLDPIKVLMKPRQFARG
jgi:hypothetical protein